MVSIVVYSKNIQIRYLSTICSKATFFLIISRIISIIIPLIIAYNTKGFWLKNDSFYEQPNVKFTYEYFFYAEDAILDKSLMCSNVIQLENTFHCCSTIKVYEYDYDFDGKYDKLSFNLSITNDKILNIKSFILILGMDFQTKGICPFKLQTASIIQYSNINPGERFNFIGDLKFVQNTLISCDQSKMLTNITSIFKRRNFDLWDFLKENFNKNLSTKIDNSYTMWRTGDTSSTFNVDIIIRYFPQLIYYKPSFWQVIKFAWIQYLSIFIATTWVINKIQDYIFTNKLVLYRVDYPDKKL